MLSEDLQNRIGCDQTTEAGVPHGSKVFAHGLVEFDDEGFITLPSGLTIGGQAGGKSLRIGQVAGLNTKRQCPHEQHRGAFTLLLRALGGWPVLARSSWQLLVR